MRPNIALLIVAMGVTLPLLAQRDPVPTPGSDANSKASTKPKPLGGEWEVKFIDDSSMKLTVLDEVVTLITPYGPLNIPLAEIQKIEVGTRLNDADVLRLQTAEKDIQSKDNAKREAAKDVLLGLGVPAIPAIRRAIKMADNDTRPHFTQVLEKLVAQLEDPKKEPMDLDVIHTENSKIAGRLSNPTMRIQTFQFGELKLKLADVKAMSFGGFVEDIKYELVQTNYVYQVLSTHMGKTVGIRVTAQVGGSVWGSNPYTGDTSLATAAVHAGVLKPGETGIVILKLIPTPQGFTGSTANGVTTSSYGPYHSGAYEIIRPRK